MSKVQEHQRSQYRNMLCGWNTSWTSQTINSLACWSFWSTISVDPPLSPSKLRCKSGPLWILLLVSGHHKAPKPLSLQLCCYDFLFRVLMLWCKLVLETLEESSLLCCDQVHVLRVDCFLDWKWLILIYVNLLHFHRLRGWDSTAATWWATAPPPCSCSWLSVALAKKGAADHHHHQHQLINSWINNPKTDYYLDMIPTPDTGHLRSAPKYSHQFSSCNPILSYWSSAQLSYWIHHVSNLSRIAVEVTTTITAELVMINLHHRDRITKWWTLFIASYIFLPGLAAYHASWCYFLLADSGLLADTQPIWRLIICTTL